MNKPVSKITNKYTRIITAALVFFLILGTFIIENTSVYAAGSISVKLSSSNVSVGGEFTATVTFSGGGESVGAIKALVTYDKSVIQYVSCDKMANETSDGIILSGVMENLTQKSFIFKIKFKSIKSGKSTVKVSPNEFVTADSNPLSVSPASASVTVSNASGNADLKSLTVNTGSLSPKFAAGTQSYKVELSSSVKNITVSATAADSKATISGTGRYNLTAGKSTTINIKVTAENKSTVKTYKIVVTVAPAPSSSPGVTTPKATQEATETPGETETPTETPIFTLTHDNTLKPTITVTESPIKEIDSSNTKDGLFSTKSAFILCALGMFIIGVSVGFIACYILKCKKQKI